MNRHRAINVNIDFNVLNIIPDWVRITDLSGHVVFCNKTFIRDLNFDPCGKTISELKTTKYADVFKDNPRTDVFYDEDIVRETIKYEGQIYDCITSPITDKYNNIIAFVDVYRNITVQKRMETQLTIKNELMNQDLILTKRIQDSILPRELDFGKLKVDYLYLPCDDLSGDIFDVIRIDDNKTSAYIADVSGHGVSAAMVTVFVREAMRSLYETESTASDLKEVHKRFLNLSLDVDQYLTMFHLIIDNELNNIKYSNAGHNCPMFLIKDHDVKLISIPGKPISSYFDEINYKEENVDFNPGDKILLITDGIKETQNKNGEEYGLDRVESILRRKPNDILLSLRRSIDYFNGGERYDDICAVLIEYKSER